MTQNSLYYTLSGSEPVDDVSYLEVVARMKLAIATGLSRDSVSDWDIHG